MRAMLLEEPRRPLAAREIPEPSPGPNQVLVRVSVCGVCRTDLHIIDGELDEPKLPLVPGHEIVGTVAGFGDEVEGFEIGERVGIPWLGGTCGSCASCHRGSENLCDEARLTGYHRDGGYAEYTVADANFCFRLSAELADTRLAPLLCAGLIGYRSLRMTGDPRRVGIYGFGAAAHIVTQVARHEGRDVYAFTRAGDVDKQGFAHSLDACWASDSGELPPVELDAAILFAPVGELVPQALRAVRKGGVVVCAGIHMSDIPSFPYELLWGERQLRSVANLTRADGIQFLNLAAQIPVRTDVQIYPLADANLALMDLRAGRVRGAAVLTLHEAFLGRD